MLKLLLNRVGIQAAHAVAGGHLSGSRFNMKLGFALMRDRRISFWPKLVAMGLGGAVTALVIALEISPELLLGAVLPVLGWGLDLVTDGMEAVILPFLFGALLIPFIAPRHLVDQVMMERAGVGTPSLPTTS